MSDAKKAKPAPESRGQPFRVRLPGFLVPEEVGLGDVMKRATSVAGIRPCGGCARRASALNERVRLSPWRKQ